ncbi:hypothetical protein [Pedobacter miscanthi]|nr:hypothetical protein [Pedobacter miscanthi]
MNLTFLLRYKVKGLRFKAKAKTYKTLNTYLLFMKWKYQISKENPKP